MKKFFYSLFALAMTLNASAQDTSDAANFFTNSAWGFATVSDEAGAPYVLDGGMRAAKPKTIILTTTGGDDDNAIKSAIASYDIIVLDGSKGQFTISAQMKFDNTKNKTIVGRNNAVLATKFFLTADDIAYLKSQNLEGLSSTDQYTGTLPDGTTLTCDKRAFFTKKAIEELQYKKTGKYSLPNNAGIFQFNQTCENIIVRNLTLQGPGAVDIDGSDLLYDAYATHLWVDHCTFIDSQDGALDTRGDWNTYTWNHFYYTSRSFSHAYTCGLGWVSDHSTVLHCTWGYNIWGKGCNRRLPQADDCYLHLVNNYHNCPGNSAGMTINSYATALVEGNYAAAGVNSPLTGSGANRKVYARSNSFSYSSTSTSVTVPYAYEMKLTSGQVPTVLTATHGAGATLDHFMPIEDNTPSADNFGFYNTDIEIVKGATIMAEVKNFIGAKYKLTSSDESVATVSSNGTITAKADGTTTINAVLDDDFYGAYTATVKVTVKSSSSEYQTVRKWDFKPSSDTWALLAEDGDWTFSSNTYIYSPVLSTEPLYVDGDEREETKDLLFTCPAGKLVWYNDRLRFNKENSVIIIPGSLLQAGDKLVISWKSANATDQRGFNLANASPAQIRTDGTGAEKEVIVSSASDVTLTVTGGIHVYYIELQRQNGTAVSTVSASVPSAVKTGKTYDLSGKMVASDTKGIVIIDGKKFLNK